MIAAVLASCATACSAPEEQAAEFLQNRTDEGILSGVYAVWTPESGARIVGTAPLDETSRFRIASLTKVFTQTAILRLVDQDRLALDQSLASARPGFDAEWAQSVSLRHLLNFSSGLPAEMSDATPPTGVALDADGRGLAFMDRLAEPGPETDPGVRTNYSNLGYMHLGAVLEAATGLSYAEAVAELVIEPAGLTDTGFGVDRLGQNGHVRGYQRDGQGQPAEVSTEPVSPRYSTGGLYSSVRDLQRLTLALLDPGFLSDNARQEFFTQFGRPDATDPGFVIAGGHLPGFAHGWAISRAPEFSVISLNNTLPENVRAVPDSVREAARQLGADIPVHEERYRPIATDGWVAIATLDEIPPAPGTPAIRTYLDALLASDRAATLEARLAMSGLNPAALSPDDREAWQGIVDFELGVFNRFGPFSATAWRTGEGQLTIYFDSADDERGVHLGFETNPDQSDQVTGVRLGSYGFTPD